MIIDRYHSAQVLTRRVQVLARHLGELAPLGAGIVDVGCGDGQVAWALLNQRPDLSLSGVDILAREHTAIPVRIFDGVKLPHPDASEDMVMFVDVLHHTSDPMILLREAVRVSRRWVLIKDHSCHGWAAGPTLRFMDWVGNARHGVALPFNYWPSRSWQGAFTELRLKPSRSIEKLGLYPWWADWIFGRQLHFITLLEKSQPA